MTSENPWADEDEYRRYLETERKLFAWVLVHYGSMSEAEAEKKALHRYPWESAEDPYRGLIFHDEAWHWAMLELHGNGYWHSRPELQHQPTEYQQELERLQS